MPSRPLARACASLLLAAEALVVSLIWLTCLPSTAFAYVDPSVMTYTIQALAGVAVALSAVAGVVFRRARKKAFKVLNIDENANKAVDGRISRIDPRSPNAGVEFMEAGQRAKAIRESSESDAEKRGLASLTWKKRLPFALLMCSFAFFIILIAPALEIFGANGDSLVFQLDTVWWVTVVFNMVFAVVCAFALSAIRGKAFLAAMLFVFCLTMCAYCQAFFMNAGMMPADGGYIGWEEPFFVDKYKWNTAVWLAILIIPQIISMKHRIVWLKATSAIAVAVIIMQLAGVVSVSIDAGKTATDMHNRPYVTQGGLYEVHPQNNVIVLVVDSFDTKTLEDLREKDPDILSGFADFTYFRNNAGVMVPTQYAVPYMLTGNKPQPGQNLEEYRTTRYERSQFVPSIERLGYYIGIYTDSAMLDFLNPSDIHIARASENIHRVSNLPIDVWQTYLVMNQCALYRESPWILKQYFWYYTTDINNRMIGKTRSSDGHDELYELDDAGIMQRLRESGLSFMPDNKAADKAGSFKFIHLFGPHFPFSVDENGNDVGLNNSDIMRQAQGSLKVVGQYLSELKKLGVYDNATIIVTADHGIWDEREDPVQKPTSPILLVKPSVAAGQGGNPVQVSDMPVSQADFEPTIIAALGFDASQFGSGIPVWSASDPNRIRYYDALTSKGEGERRLIEYMINGQVIDIESWSKTGNEWSGL